jgi:hypothetical protein
MTGRELQRLLNALPDEELDRDVVTEGCDCYGEAVAVKLGVWPWREKEGKNIKTIEIERER